MVVFDWTLVCNVVISPCNPSVIVLSTLLETVVVKVSKSDWDAFPSNADLIILLYIGFSEFVTQLLSIVTGLILIVVHDKLLLLSLVNTCPSVPPLGTEVTLLAI